MYLTIIGLPLLGGTISGMLGRKGGGLIISTVGILLSLILTLMANYEVILSQSAVSINIGNWLDNEHLWLDWNLRFDALTISMLTPVLTISLMVHIYSMSYMSSDPHKERFFSYLSLFTGFMLILVASDNYLMLFIGWEGIGICSYLLINFWYSRLEANGAAIKAILTNRVGDWGLTIGIISIFWLFKDVDYNTVYQNISSVQDSGILLIISLGLIIASMAKSAQLGLHGWLPYSMAGPTPVSALIHAATLVTAGVYLLLRSSGLLEWSEISLVIILWVGSLTVLYAASIGIVQNDIKKVIAYSTCSQLGMLFIGCGLSQYDSSLYHLVNHGYFKALLFLSGGAVIHGLLDGSQDIRKLGGLLSLMPLVYTMMIIGSLSLMAFPALTGYYSKHYILEIVYGQYSINGIVGYWLAALGATLTAYYSIRLLYLIFISEANGVKQYYETVREADWITTLVLIILGLLTITVGYITKDGFIGLGSDIWENSMFTHPSHLIISEYSIPSMVKEIPLILSIVGGTLGWLLTSPLLNIRTRGLYRLLSTSYRLDLLLQTHLSIKILELGYITGNIIDKGVLEIVGPLGLQRLLIRVSRTLTRLDSGLIFHYGLYLLVGILIITILIMLPSHMILVIILSGLLML